MDFIMKWKIVTFLEEQNKSIQPSLRIHEKL